MTGRNGASVHSGPVRGRPPAASIGVTQSLARSAEAMRTASDGRVPGQMLPDLRNNDEAGADPGRATT